MKSRLSEFRGRRSLEDVVVTKQWPGILIILIVLLCLSASGSGLAQTLDYSVKPKSDDNFLEASFRFKILPSSGSSNAVLVYVPGTDGDGRDMIANPDFLKIATACHASLLGCCYRGKEFSYDNPSAGSGRAFDEALAYFSGKTGLPQLKNAKLLLVGFSQGGMFVYNYVCLHPQRVKAFAVLRAVSPRFKPQPESFEVPGLLAAGEYDEAGRIRSIANVFSNAEGHDSRWIFLLEKQSGHEMGGSLSLAGALFEAVSQKEDTGSPLLFDTMTREVVHNIHLAPPSCWFPNQTVASLWKVLHRPTALQDLIVLSDKPQLQDFLMIEETPQIYECKNGDSQFGSITISARNSKVAMGDVSVSGNGFTLVDSSSLSLPQQIKVCFAPKNMTWGSARASIVVTGKFDGHVAEAAETTLVALVKGPLTPIPSIVYFGKVVPGQTVRKTILLKSNRAEVHCADIRAPDGMSVTLNSADNYGDLLLDIRWAGSSRLGDMQGDIEIAVDAPEKGILRIPVFGYVALVDSHPNERDASKTRGHSLSPERSEQPLSTNRPRLERNADHDT